MLHRSVAQLQEPSVLRPVRVLLPVAEPNTIPHPCRVSLKTHRSTRQKRKKAPFRGLLRLCETACPRPASAKREPGASGNLQNKPLAASLDVLAKGGDGWRVFSGGQRALQPCDRWCQRAHALGYIRLRGVGSSASAWVTATPSSIPHLLRVSLGRKRDASTWEASGRKCYLRRG